jgi:hypothetical protein
MSTFRTDVTDKEQSDLEQAEFDSGAPVFVDQKRRIVSRGRGGAQRVHSSNGVSPASGKSAGVVMPHDDTPHRFVEETQGKA